MQAGFMTAPCSACGEVKEGAVPVSRSGQPPPPFVCFGCAKKAAESGQ
jgi:hypothetical protein